MNNVIANVPVVCPIVQNMGHSNKCDYPELRKGLSSRTKERCACAGESGKQCVLRCIPVGDVNIVQRFLYHQEFKSRGDRNPMAEIQQAIRAYEKQRTLTSRFTRCAKSALVALIKLFPYTKFHESIRSASH